MNARTVTLNHSQGSTPVHVVPAENGALAFVTPTKLLGPGLTHTLSLSGVIDQHGLTLPATAIRFTTEGSESERNGLDAGDDGDENWKPGPEHLKGNWKMGKADERWRSLPALEAEPGVTALSGRVLKLNGFPLAKVTVQIGNQKTQTDSTGRFLLRNLSPGKQLLIVDGETANRPGRTYCMFEMQVNVVKGRTNVVPWTFWMPLQDTQHTVSFPSPTTREVVVTNPNLPGLKLVIPAGVVLRGMHGQVLTSITLTPIPADRLPFPFPFDVNFLFTAQLHGAPVQTPDGKLGPDLRIEFPNYSSLPAGYTQELWSYNPNSSGWYRYAQGTVSSDGAKILPDRGVKTLHCLIPLGGDAPAKGPKPGDKCERKQGDPVDTGTGLFEYSKTDLYLPDVLPIQLSRHYRSSDVKSRSFGLGTLDPYNWYLVGDTNTFSYVELILEDGGRVRFNRTSPGTTLIGAILTQTQGASEFHASTLSWDQNRQGWDLRMKDGRLYQFQGYHPAQGGGPPALVAIQDRYGNRIGLQRDGSHRITRILSP
ncbi:MAG: carboxypeptidase-like regulatory domain-containing protein, partial [Acidobacteria bacterium]|nr:carboxypeptidase-like regulatory domain-containing protein [Acidobacteriota bacterium]